MNFLCSSIMISGALLMVVTLILGMGVPVLAAHMFIFYFSILADATPPVSVACYAAASIAEADSMHVGLVASRLASAAFIIGFSYLYTPALLMQGPWSEILPQIAVNLLGLTIMAAGFFGYFRGDINGVLRYSLVFVDLGLVLLEAIDKAMLGVETRFRETLAAMLERCHAAGQAGPADFNCLHQDLYGEHVFPIQATFLLSVSGKSFEGGDFVLVEQRPRKQSRARGAKARRE